MTKRVPSSTALTPLATTLATAYVATVVAVAAVAAVAGNPSHPTHTCIHHVQASAAGSKEQDAINFLEKKVKVGTPLPTDEAVRLAISTMQSILSSDFKAAEIEMSVARADAKVRVLTEAEIDAHLTVLAERD